MPNFGEFNTTKLGLNPIETAPDGSTLRRLLGVAGGTMAHFELSAGETSRAIAHRTVDELWFVVSGSGQLWLKQGTRQEVIALAPGVCASLPRGTRFQFRASEAEAVAIVAVTIPRWPGSFEAEPVDGRWPRSEQP